MVGKVRMVLDLDPTTGQPTMAQAPSASARCG